MEYSNFGPQSDNPPPPPEASGPTDTSASNFKPAPTFPLPARSLFCVEHPARVQDVNRAITTLGGLPAVTKAFQDKSKFLALRFRPEDPYSHPLFGDYSLGSSLLLKVTRRKRDPHSSAGKDEQNCFKTDMMATVTALYQFKGMADFQYVPPREVVEKEQRGAFQLISEGGLAMENEPMHLPPPIFSKIDMPQNYRFLPNPLFQVIEETGPNGEVTKHFERVWKKKQPALLQQKPTIGMEADEVPQGPLAKGEQEKSQDMEYLEGLIRQMFQDRPIWSSTAVRANIPLKLASKMKSVLPMVGYYFKSGPWRKMWVRFAYDPRQHPESRIYQVFDCRVSFLSGQSAKFPAPFRRRQPVQVDISSVLQPTEPSTKESKSLDYRFLTLPTRQQTLYQLCDIADTTIQELVNSPESLSPTFKKTTGWYTQTALDLIKRRMNERLAMLLAAQETQKTDEDEETEIPATPTEGLLAQPPTPLIVHSEKIRASAAVLEQILNLDDEGEIESFGLLDEESVTRPDFYTRLLQDEEYDEFEYDEEEGYEEDD